MRIVRESLAPPLHRREESEDDKESVHLLHTSGRPPPGGGTCQCIRCGLHFQSRSTTWTTDRQKHDANTFTGKFKSCTAAQEKD